MAKKGFTRRGALVAVTSAAAATAACGSQSVETPPYSGAVAFNHGVASGDPQADKVVIWTRVTPEQAGAVPVPQVDCVHLADYRLRHAQYKTEAELQALHAKAPWITVWDDHEVANDDWTGGAENHHANEGAWGDRKRAALQAYYEWMPIRE